MTSKEYALLSAKVLSEKKAVDIKIIDISKRSSFADYLVIATGNSIRQINSFVDYVEDEYEKNGLNMKSAEGKSISGWILADFGDVIVNLFVEEERQKYNLEKVWKDCPLVDFE